MYYSLNPLREVIWGTISGSTIGLIKGDTRCLNSSSYVSYLLA